MRFCASGGASAATPACSASAEAQVAKAMALQATAMRMRRGMLSGAEFVGQGHDSPFKSAGICIEVEDSEAVEGNARRDRRAWMAIRNSDCAYFLRPAASFGGDGVRCYGITDELAALCQTGACAP